MRLKYTAILILILWPPSALAETYELPLFVSQTASGQQGVLRILNLWDDAGTVAIHAIDDTGVRTGPATLSLDALASVELETADLVTGNGAKGLSGGLGSIAGDVRLEFDTILRIQFLAQLRSADGARVSMHDAVRLDPVEVEGGFEFLVPVFNPARHMAHESRLRLVNPTSLPASVTIGGRDEAGASATGGSVGLTLPAGGATTLTAQQLEAGDASIAGQLGTGSGGWRLRVSSDRPIQVVNLVLAATGELVNLSTTGLAGNAPIDHAAFEDRFEDLVIGVETREESSRLSIEAGDRFTESVESDGAVRTSEGGYAYVRTGADAGRLTQAHEGGRECKVSLYFTSATAGWFASRCVDVGYPDGRWRGGRWSVAGNTSPSFPASSAPVDQSYTAGSAISPLALPAAEGGDGALTYSLSPIVPGLAFDPVNRELTGTPTAAGTHRMTYTATDADGDRVTLGFTITVGERSGGMTGAAGDCRVGLLVRPGESCTYPGTDDAFSVDADGRGSFLVISSGRAINVNNANFSGRRYDFRASHQGDSVWRIDRLEGSTTRPPGGVGAVPEFAAASGPGDKTYRVGEAIPTLTLPEAIGGDGTLTYDLSPDIPGLTFDPETRELNGTPTVAATHSMTYTATDTQGDLDTLSFAITIEAPPDTMPSFQEAAAPEDQTYTVGTTIPALTLPVASGGDGTLIYSLMPDVPGLTFNPETRELTGTPRVEASHTMTYTVTDADGDTDSLSFTVSVQASTGLGPWDGLGTQYDVGDRIAEMPANRSWWLEYFGDSIPRGTEGYRYLCWSISGCRIGNQEVLSGTVIQLSTADMSLEDEFPNSRLHHVHGDNVIVMQVREDVSNWPLDFAAYARDFFTWFEDEFDYLLFLSNLSSYEESRGFGYAGIHISVMNDTDGLGISKHFDREYGSAGRLRSVVHIVRDNGLRFGPSLHEIQHAWANFAVPTANAAHWGFSSANGQIGGFDMSNLVDLGDGRWSAGVFGVNGNGHRGEPVLYSPIELYFAGLAGPEEVPDLWVAEHGEWLLDGSGALVTDDDGNPVFRADNPRTITIDDIIEENGARNPPVVERRHQRAAVILLTDRHHPPNEAALEIASHQARWLGLRDDDGGAVANYYTATGGRATLTLDGLSEFRKSAAAAPAHLPDSFGDPPAPHAMLKDGTCMEL